MSRAPIKQRSLRQRVEDIGSAIGKALTPREPESAVDRQFSPRGPYIPPVKAGGKVMSTGVRPTASGARVISGGRESGAASVDAYIKSMSTPAYKNATPQAKRKFRRESEADLGQFKDVI